MCKSGDEYYMSLALKKAKIAAKNGDIPVGCVIVYKENLHNEKMCTVANVANVLNGQVVSTAYNMRNKKKNVIAHAEMIAISRACKIFNDFRLEECVLYVTLEPCQMCAGAIVQSRIKKIVIGAKSFKSGSCGSIINILNNNDFNHKVEVEYIENCKCEKIMKDFFKGIRNGK